MGALVTFRFFEYADIVWYEFTAIDQPLQAPKEPFGMDSFYQLSDGVPLNILKMLVFL